MKSENADISMFFETIRSNSESNSKAETFTGYYLESVKAVSNMLKESIFVIDFQQQKFRFVSDKGIFLCGRTSDEVLTLGFKFYREIVHPEDFPLIAKIHQIIFRYFSCHDKTIRDLDCVVFNYRIRSDRKYLMVSHKMAPLFFDNCLGLAVSTVSDSMLETSGKLYAYFNNGKDRREYSFADRFWEKSPQLTLTQLEKDILLLAKQGKQEKEIANILCKQIQTIKNQKVELFDKLEVNNTQQAITFAANHFLI